MDNNGEPVEAKRTCDCHPGCIAWHNRDGRLRGSEQPIDGHCGAHLRGTDPPRYCCRRPTASRERCRTHGGTNARGLAHHAHKHGRYSKMIPAGPMADAYERMHADRSQLHSLADDIAIQEAFRASAISQIDGANLQAMIDAIESVADAMTRDRAPIPTTEAAEQLRAVAGKARDAQSAMRRATQASHDKAKLIETDLKRMQQQENMVTTEQAISFAYAVGDGMKAVMQRLGAQPSDYAELRDLIQRSAVRWLLGAGDPPR